MVQAIYQIILHLNKITECLKITTFKIVLTFDVFFSPETTMHCKVTCILYKKQAHFSNTRMALKTILCTIFENSNRHMNEGLTLLIAISENR
jgi:hypothetical protein